MENGNLQEALKYAADNPNSDFAFQLAEHIRSGKADREAQQLGIDLTPIKGSDIGVPPSTEIQEKPKKSFYEKALDAGTAVTNFIGGKAIADTFGTEIAKAQAKPEYKQYVEEGPGLKEVLGSAAQVGSLFVPVGAVAKGASLGAKALGLGAKSAKLAGNVVAGAGTGALFDAGEKLQTGETSGLGTAIGGAIPLAGPVAKLVGKGTGRVAGEVLGKTTGAGYGAIKEGVEATIEGGAKGEAFRKGLRGNTSPEALVDEAKQGLQTIVQQRRNSYLTQLEKIAGNKEALDISPIVKKVGDNLEQFNIGVTDDGALDFSRSALRFNTQAQKDIQQIVDTMKGYGTQAGDRTAVQVDNLKQALQDLYSPSGQARAFVESIRKTTREVLSKVPGYDDLAKNYGEKTELIGEISRGLSLGDKASVDTSFKKLTSALRQNNEFRKELISELDEATGGFLSAKIAGQQLSSIAPRGLSGPLGAVGGTGALLTGIGIAKLIPALVAFSPRAVGELVSVLGFTGNKAKILTDYLVKNAGKLQAPGDAVIEGIRQDVKSIDAIPNKQGGFVSIGGKTIKAVDEATKKEMVSLMDYLNQKTSKVEKFKTNEKMERTLDDIIKKYKINPDWSNAKIADKIMELIENTNTI